MVLVVGVMVRLVLVVVIGGGGGGGGCSECGWC